MIEPRRGGALLGILALLLGAGVAASQTLALSGPCPGEMTLTVTGATPEGRVAFLTGSDLGPDVVPGGPCTGTPLDITGSLVLRGALFADEAGQVSANASIPEAACGLWLQALDVGPCGVSNAVPVGSGEPIAIDVACAPTANLLRFGCTVTVDPPQPVEVRYRRTDGIGPERANRSEITADTHQVSILFLGPEREYGVVATALDHPQGLSATDSFTTGAAPTDYGSWLTMQGASTMELVGADLPCGEDAVAVVYDTETGDLVWYQELDPFGVLGLNDMVRFTDEQTVLGETGNAVVEVDLLGEVLTEFDTAPSLHHDIFESNDSYYVLDQERIGGLTLDPVLVYDPQGALILEWDPRDHLPIPPDASGDWLHTNALWVEEDGTALLSWLSRDSVAKIDLDPASPTFNQVLWIVDGDPPDDLPADIVVDWSGVDGADFFSRQHNFHRRRDGRFMLLDNDHGRGVVLTIDEVARTATANAVYATVESVCGPQGTAADTEAGNSVVGCSTEFLREYDGLTDELVWEAEVECESGGGFFGISVGRWYPLDGWSKAYTPVP